MKLRLFMFIFLLGSSVVGASPETACQPSSSSCVFYSCMEDKFSCGNRGYWLSFGYRYCQSFLKDEKHFSPKAQAWLQEVRQCLQERLQEGIEEKTCRQIHTYAIGTHLGCYRDTGFCNLALTDKLHVYWYLKSAATDPLTWVQAARIQQICHSK